MSNGLRIPFAEWLYRMSDAAVPYQARALAVYAVAFKVTSNDELARLVGMDSLGVADKTYNKWKRYLSENGWVIVRQVSVGRQTTIEVDPALAQTPVTFTDLKEREARKYYEPQPVKITDGEPVKSTGPEVEITTEPELITAQTVKITDETVKTTTERCSSRAPTRARFVSPSGIVIPRLDNKNPPLPPSGGKKDDDLSELFGEHENVALIEGRLVLHNGYRAFWLEQFGGDDKRLDLALIQAANYVQPNTRRPLETQVAAQLARLAGDKRDRDIRYAAAAKSNAPAAKKPFKPSRW